MTHEERASRIKKVFWIVLILAVVAGAWFYPKPVAEEKSVAASEAPEVPANADALMIVLYHSPGDPDSAHMAEILSRIELKYGQQVFVTKVDFTASPESAREQAVAKVPHVVMSARGQRLFDFQGPWPYPQVERKVDELLHGLKRFGKDWRPPVPGMTRTGG
jgi:hypothetical protein